MDIETQIEKLKDDILLLMGEEESLKHLKNETAKEFRVKINEKKALRLKKLEELKALKQKSVEEKGTMVLKGAKLPS